MSINSVSFNGFSQNAKNNAVSKPAFKGNSDVPIDMLSKNTEKGEKEKFKITPEKIKEKSEAFSENVDAFTDSLDKTTNSVTNAVTKTTGATAHIGAAFSKIIPTPVKDFFATPQFVTENGKEVLNEAGQKILLMKKGSDGIERVVRKFNGKNTLIALGVASSLVGLYALYKYVKNKNAKKAEQKPAAA